jgi:hypothetical protein
MVLTHAKSEPDAIIRSPVAGSTKLPAPCVEIRDSRFEKRRPVPSPIWLEWPAGLRCPFRSQQNQTIQAPQPRHCHRRISASRFPTGRPPEYKPDQTSDASKVHCNHINPLLALRHGKDGMACKLDAVDSPVPTLSEPAQAEPPDLCWL